MKSWSLPFKTICHDFIFQNLKYEIIVIFSTLADIFTYSKPLVYTDLSIKVVLQKWHIQCIKESQIFTV